MADFAPRHESCRIERVADRIDRPLWSVMIPTYNCARYLRQTLASVLGQDPGPAQMQIEVVDDCSTADDPAAVVREVGRGRVAFYRQPSNCGMSRNWNTCVSRSRGELVHILHGDDFVLPGFRDCIEALARQHPEAALLATRCVFVDAAGRHGRLSRRVSALEQSGTDVGDFFYQTPVQCVGVVVRRALYERCGGFDESLSYVADREMWMRAIVQGRGVVAPAALAAYRVFAESMTGRLARTAANLREMARFNASLAQRYPGFRPGRARARLVRLAWKQHVRFTQAGDLAAAQANLRFWREQAGPVEQLSCLLRKLVLPRSR